MMTLFTEETANLIEDFLEEACNNINPGKTKKELGEDLKVVSMSKNILVAFYKDNYLLTIDLRLVL